MLKQVMLGSGGIMLAAAIFASSYNTGPAPAGTPVAAPVSATPVVAPAPSQPHVAPSAPPLPAEDTGDTQFGAPMISTKPVAEAVAEPLPIFTDPDSAVANGGRQYNARPGHSYPIPK